MFIINKKRNEISSLPAKEINGQQTKALSSKLAQKILFELAKESNYPMGLAKSLKVNEQKIYYHIKNLEKARIIEVVKTTSVQGTQANFYELTEPAFIIKFKNFEKTQKVPDIQPSYSEFLIPFIENGQLNANIIVGSPDPHGPEKARSRDGYYGIDFALFLGSFLNYLPELHVKLDTEVRTEDLHNNIILIGGPIINTITGKVNNKLPIRFDKDNSIISKVSNKSYYSDECGIIVKTKNPFNPKKKLLLIAGKRYSGTRAAIIAFLKHFEEIVKGNKFDNKIEAKIVEGVDLNSDGIVDSVEILE